MSDVEDLRGSRLYDAFMALKPDKLAETEWAESAGLNRGFFTNIKAKEISPRISSIRKLLSYIGKTEGQLYAAAAGEVVSRARLPDSIDKASDNAVTRDASADDAAAEVIVLDLSLPMGPGADIEDYIEETVMKLDVGLLRVLTRSAPEKLRVIRGIGDSMAPTITNSDLVIIDTAYSTMDFEDKIWAVRIRGFGAIKRLRSASKGQIRIISDNPDVENDIADMEEIVILGRVVGSIKTH